MKDLVQKIAVGLATGALVSQAMVFPALGTINVVMDGNGYQSDNDAKITTTTQTTVSQNNYANVSNDVDAKANTGGNQADKNTGGDISIDTGDAEALVKVDNKVNSNEASVDCGGCPTDVNVEISSNGANSDNDVNLKLTNQNWIKQNNVALLDNDVEVKANSGKNEADKNTDGDISIDTGNATAVANVSNMANANVAHIGNGSGSGSLDLLITGNGYRSDSDINVTLANTDTIWQNNFANISNDVEVKANTGKNEADKNTGGSVSIDTGDAGAGATVDNMANFNFADVTDCCEFDGLVKVAGNGAKSENDVNLNLTSGLFVDQNNRLSCKKHPFPFPWFGQLEFSLDSVFPWGGWDKDCNDVDAYANTGKNEMDKNTGDPEGDPSIDTGDASTLVEVETTGNSNVFSTGDALPEWPDLPEDWDFDQGSMSLLVMLWQLLVG